MAYKFRFGDINTNVIWNVSKQIVEIVVQHVSNTGNLWIGFGHKLPEMAEYDETAKKKDGINRRNMQMY